jgi:uncharacterized membrane protein
MCIISDIGYFLLYTLSVYYVLALLRYCVSSLGFTRLLFKELQHDSFPLLEFTRV